MIISEDVARAVRRKRADNNYTKKQACLEIGITAKTLYRIECCENYKVRQTVYMKISDWLAKNY